MKFGVYIRSIGERTEKLCLESCYQHIDSKDVHLLKNYFPSYNVYMEMFQRALKSEYDWFLAIDADVVLYKNWFEMVKKDIERYDCKKVFKFTYLVDDYILREPIDRGNHIYNNKFSKQALKELKKNILITKSPRFFKKHYQSGRYLKPETSIRHKMREKYNIDNFNFKELIGIHGTEQYLYHVFQRFVSRANRNPDYINKYHFLEKSNQEILLQQEDIDRYVANLGWNYGMKHSIDRIDARDIRGYQKVFDKFMIQEWDVLNMTLGKFYEKYFNMNRSDVR